MLRLASILITLVVTTTTAVAQPTSEDPAPARPRKSKITAMSLSIGSLVAGGALAAGASLTTEKAIGGPLAVASAGAFLIGPSLGHLYAGEWGRATTLTLARAAGAAVFTLGMANALDDHGSNNELFGGVAVAGAAVVLGATLYDIIDTPFAVNRANRALTIAPTVLSTPDGGRAAGLSIGGRF